MEGRLAAGRLSRIDVRVPGRPQLRLLAAWVIASGAVIRYTVRAVTQLGDPTTQNVDFGVYLRAAQSLAAGHHIYSPSTACCYSYAAMDGQYTYPPLMAVVLRPLSGVAPDTAGRLWLLVSHAALIAAIIVMRRTVGAWLSHTAQLVLLAAVLVFEPVMLGLHGIQVASVLLLIYAVAAFGFVQQRDRITGVALATGAALKVAPVFMLAPLLTVRRVRLLRTVGVFALTLGGAFLLMWAVVPETPDYLTRVLPQFAGGVIAPYNRSLPGVVLQVYDAAGVQPGRLFAIAGTLVTLVLVLITWRVARGERDARGRAVVFASFLALLPIVQGVTWDHHLVNELLVLVLLAPSLRALSAAWWLAIASYPLLSLNLQALGPWMQSAGIAHPQGAPAVAAFTAVMSISLLGMVLLWAATLMTLRTGRRGA